MRTSIRTVTTWADPGNVTFFKSLKQMAATGDKKKDAMSQAAENVLGSLPDGGKAIASSSIDIP